MLAFDLGVFNKKVHVVSFKESLFWTIFWIGLSLVFYVFIYFNGYLIHGLETVADVTANSIKFSHPINVDGLTNEQAINIYNHNLSLEFLTGYLIEKTLSLDNIFVIIMIFTAFGIDKLYYHKILFWGILGALVMRFIFIFLCSALIQEFSWLLYFFGLLLVFTGLKMLLSKEKKIDTENHIVVRFASKHFPVDHTYKGGKFTIIKNGKRLITPLMIVLLVIEFSDVIFAVDSIPAIFSVTKDPYIVFFSNIFAIIGLRALFFLLINIINLFRFLKHGVSILLTVIGIKMLIPHPWMEEIGFEPVHSLYLVLGILSISIIASLVFPKSKDVCN